jgi:hypothetical protein
VKLCEALLEATEKELQKVRARIENGSLAGRDKIGVRVGKVVNKYKVGKHFALTIEETGFQFKRLAQQIAAEAALNKLGTRKLKDGSPVHSFRTLLDELSTIVRNTCEPRLRHKAATTFQMTTIPNPAQQRALQLLQLITV